MSWWKLWLSSFGKSHKSVGITGRKAGEKGKEFRRGKFVEVAGLGVFLFKVLLSCEEIVVGPS